MPLDLENFIAIWGSTYPQITQIPQIQIGTKEFRFLF